MDAEDELRVKALEFARDDLHRFEYEPPVDAVVTRAEKYYQYLAKRYLPS